MALNPIDERHLGQIKAGTVGRKRGHQFEQIVTADLNAIVCGPELAEPLPPCCHLYRGNPAILLIRYIASREAITKVNRIQAWWLGGLATSGRGDTLTDDQGRAIKASKSDIVIELEHVGGKLSVGVSVKSCNNRTPTNDQLYFTTATAFCTLLRRNGIEVSQVAEDALRMFCGDIGYRPKDTRNCPRDRVCDPDRWFWEELPKRGRSDLEGLLMSRQLEVSTILLQKAYREDPFAPSYLLHQIVKYDDIHDCQTALFTIDELLQYSCKYSGFATREYRIRKGRFKHDTNTHLAPRFGYIQFQRAGNKQHPTQLQFNLQAGYFNKLLVDS